MRKHVRHSKRGKPFFAGGKKTYSSSPLEDDDEPLSRRLRRIESQAQRDIGFRPWKAKQTKIGDHY